jgi:hypothetical protein
VTHDEAKPPEGRPMSVTSAKNVPIGMEQIENTCIFENFAHESEAEFAKFLDFYNVDWSYEPICFPIVWDDQGKVKECFTPDFHLPQFHLYVELTTMKQEESQDQVDEGTLPGHPSKDSLQPRLQRAPV